MESFNYIKDETSCCVVNIKSINKRILSMDAQEREYVQDISAQFLTHLVHIAHCREANKLKDATYSMLSLFLNNIFDNKSRTTRLRSFNLAPPPTSGTASDSGNVAEHATKTFITQVMGCLDPATIISTILNASSGDTAEDDNMLTAVNGIMSVLKNYNPVKLDDIVMLEMCNAGRGCNACHGLCQSISDEKPREAMLYFLRCINHNRFNFGGDTLSAHASRKFLEYANNPKAIVVPLRSIMMGCLDIKLVAFGDTIEYGDSDEEWLRMLYSAVSNMPLKDRGITAHFYAYMMFSRHRLQSADCIKQFLYTIFSRFIYSATEYLFCNDENSSIEFDNRNFLNYIEAVTNASVLGSTLNTVKAYRAWALHGASVAPLLDIVSSDWKRNYKTGEDLDSLGVSLVKCITEMANSSRYIRNGSANNITSGLDSVRSVRQVEKYMPFGLIETNSGRNLRLSKLGISIQARKFSNGRNFNCNSLHILPIINGCETLGPAAGMAHQSAFEKVINPENSERGTGKILGLITCLIDRVGLKNSFPSNNIQFKQRSREFIKDIIFSRNIINENLINGNCLLPETALLYSSSFLSDTARCFDTRIHSLLLVWQRPNIQMPNLSSLTASQLELLLSKHQKWDHFITRNFFNIERISFQTANAIIQNIHSDNITATTDKNRKGTVGVFDLLMTTHLRNGENAQKLVEASIDKVERDWAFASSTCSSIEKIGAKAQFTDELFDMLFDIIVVNDLKPSTLIAYSKFLGNYVNDMDELLMKMYSC